MKEKKKFKDTKIGSFLADKFPKVIETIGDAIPDKGVIGMVKNLVTNDTKATPEEKAKALQMLHEFEMTELKEVTKRWEIDGNSDSWLSKNSRPLVLLWLVFVVSIFALLDAVKSTITFSDAWISLFSSLLLTVIVAYFGGRSAEKWKKTDTKKEKNV